MTHEKASLLVLAVFTAIQIHVYAKTLPAPWVSVGCYTDAPSTNRTLNAAFTSSATNMTIEACISFCTPNGFTFAGVGLGQQCFCDNNIQATGVPASNGCTSKCTGDSTEICGGTNRTSIFKRIIPAGWDPVGCFTDQPASALTLSGRGISDIFGMTIEECIGFCAPLGFRFAGVESTGECFCGNAIESTGVLTTSGCNITCPGDPNEICGGVNHINVYNHTGLAHAVPPAAAPTIQQTVDSYEYQGCFLDLVNGTSNSLGHRKIIPGGTTLELCASYCKVAGFPIFGVEFGHECWCDSFMGLAARAPDSDCNLACEGPNSSFTQVCGAKNRLAVYTDTTATHPPLQTCLANVISLICHIESFRFDLQAVPVAGGTPLTLGIKSIVGNNGEPAIFPLISRTDFLPVNRSVDAVTFNFLNSTFWPDAVGTNGLPVAQSVTAGSEQTFIVMSGQSIQAFAQYCVMPNPLQTFGPFIGPPTIAVNGRNDLWFLCSGPSLPSPTIFFNPAPTGSITCQNVYLSMIYPSVSSTCNGC